MNRLHFTGLLVVAVGLGLVSGMGQCVRAGQHAITRLSRAYRLLEEQNPTLKQARARLEESEAFLLEQKTQRLPVLQLTARYSHVSEIARFELPFQIPGVGQPPIEAGVHDQYDLALEVQQPLFTGFRIRHAIEAARFLHQARQWDQLQVLARLKRQVGRLFYQIQENYWQQAVLEKAMTRTRIRFEMTRNLFRAQQATDFDTLEAFNQILRLETTQAALRNQARVLLAGFRRLLADSSITVAVDTTGILELPGLLPLERYLDQARRRRPELAALQATDRAARARIGIAQAGLYPQIAAQVAYHYARPGVNFFQNQWMDYYTVALQMSLPLWDWNRRKHQVKQARLRQQAVEWQLQEVEQAVQQEVQQAYWQARSALEQVQLQQRLVAQERERYRQMKSRFQTGQVSLLDFRTAEATLTQAELDLKRLQSQFARALLELDYATGELIQNPAKRGEP